MSPSKVYKSTEGVISDLHVPGPLYYFWCVLSTNTYFLDLVKINFFMVLNSSFKRFLEFVDLF